MYPKARRAVGAEELHAHPQRGRRQPALLIGDFDPPRIVLYEALALAFQAAAMAGAGSASIAAGEEGYYTLAAGRREWGVILRGEVAPPAA